MRIFSGRYRILAALLAAGAIFSTQAMTSVAGTMGVGSSRTGQDMLSDRPGQVDVGGQEESQPEQPAETQEQAGDNEGQDGVAPDTLQEQQDASRNQQGAQGQVDPQNPLQVNYSAFILQQGWSTVTADNGQCSAPAGTWVTAVRANLINIPDGAQVGVRYQANLSGKGWLDWTADGAENGDSAGVMPLEAIRMELTGSFAANYDLYYRVLQNNVWTDWAVNGAAAGVEGAGLRVDGIRMSITAKGAGVPSDPQPSPSYTFDPSRPMIALTFDDGPKTSVTSRILDSLQANGGKATFFMVGSNVNSNAGVIKRMVDQGCEVANHTHDHKYITKLNADGIISQLGVTNQKISSVCGISPVLMRPPGGYVDANSLSVVGTMGMSAVMWSIDTRDWQHRNAQRTIDTVLSQVKDGDIILMHDIYSTTADAAVVLIPELTARGYQLVTVSELAAYRGGIAPGHKYSQFRR